MDWDDLEPKKKPQVVVGEPLTAMSIADLEARIAALEDEIARVRGEIAAKKAQQQAASAFFKS